MDLARMIHDVAKTMHAKDLLSTTHVLEISYYDGIEHSVSKGIHVHPDPNNPDVLVFKYDQHEYLTRCSEELWFICDMVIPSIIAGLSGHITIKKDEGATETDTILSSTQYIGIGLYKLNNEISSATTANVIAFFYHYFESSYTAYDVLNLLTWENEMELVKLKSLLHAMLRLLVLGIRRRAINLTR